MSSFVRVNDGEVLYLNGAMISYSSGVVNIQGELPEGMYCSVEGEGESMKIVDCPPYAADVWEET